MKRETFGARLQRLRGAAGLTQMLLAERAGVPLTTLRNWEHDRREPLVSAMFKLADALGVSSEAFKDCIDGKPEPAPSAKRKGKRGGKTP
ncbi:MAG: helix-turn-helix domain-containing protein [Gemmataceae bacterium]